VTRWKKYIDAMDAGHTDAEANAIAGYESKTPSSARDMWADWQLIRDHLNEWGQGPQSVRRLIEAWKEEVGRLEGEVKAKRERINEVNRKVRIAEMVLRRGE
jgi:hypothetical protein